MLARIRSGEKPGDPVFLENENFKKFCTSTVGKVTFIRYEEALHWLNVGRIGSWFQVDKDVYVKINNKEDDIFQSYKPPVKNKNTPGPSTWSCGPKDCCGSGGCSSGDCGSGGCGSCP